MTLVELFARRLRDDPSSPLVTYYDEATGERIELSATTFDNWVAKTANLLRDELLVEPDAVVRLDLPLHWQALVWAQAAWTAGAVVELAAAADDSGTDPDPGVTVTTPDNAMAAIGDEIVVLSLRPLGLPCTDPLPPGVHDYAVVVPGHGDRFSDVPRTGSAPALSIDGAVLTHDQLIERSSTAGLAAGQRVLAEGRMATADDLVNTWIAPVAASGSVVIVAGSPDHERLERIAEAERVTPRER